MGWGHYWTKAVLAVAWKIRTLNEQSSIKGGGWRFSPIVSLDITLQITFVKGRLEELNLRVNKQYNL